MVLRYIKIIAGKSGAAELLLKNLHLILLFAYVILVCMVMVTCYMIKYFNYIYVLFLFITGVLLSKLYTILKLKGWIKPSSLIITSTVILLIIIRNLKHLLPLWNYHIIQNFYAINKGIYLSNETYFQQFLPFLIILIPLTTAVCYTYYEKGNAELSITVIFAYLFSFWNNGLYRPISIYLPFFILISVLYYSIGKRGKLVNKYRDTETKVSISFREILLLALLFSVLITLLTLAAVHKLGTRSIFEIRNDYALREAGLAGISKQNSYNVAFSGYGSGNGKLGGPIRLDSSIAFRVKASQPVYLRGTVKDYYDGQSWGKAFNNYTLKGMEALMATNQDYNLRMNGNEKEKPKPDKMTIYPGRLATSTLFSPANTLSISSKDGKVLYDTAHTFMLMGKQSARKPYILSYYVSSTGIEAFDNIKDSSFSINYNPDSSDALEKEYYQDNVERIYDSYLKVPPSITKRTYELVEAVTKDCKTTADKVERIKSYLSRNYPYSLQVSAVPENADFVDYFLFSEKKGYCTYFATTATVMCRIAGIPARYVEGFKMDEEKDSNGLYIVRNHRAHAWTEILLSPESNLWTIVDCVPQGTPISDIANTNPYMDRNAGGGQISADSRSDNAVQDEYSNASIPIFDYPLFLIPAVILLILSIFILYRLVMSSKAVASLMAAESVIPFYKHLTARLAVAGEGFPDEDCELEHARSLADKELSECLELMVKACYSEHYGGALNYPSIDRKNCNRITENYLRRKQGYFAYWYCRILRF